MASKRPRTDVDSHLSQLFGRDSLYMVLWVLQLVCAAALTPVITRFLGTGEFGIVAAGNAVMQVLFVLAGLGLHVAVQRQYADKNGSSHARKIIALNLLLGSAITALALATVGLWGRPLGFEDRTYALHLAILWAGTSVLTSGSLALLRSQDRLAAFATVSLMQSVVAEAASFALMWFRGPSADHFLEGQVLVQAVTVVMALLMAPPVRLRREDAALMRGALAFALPLVPSVLGTFALSTADRLIIQGHMGNDEVARYQVAYNIASMPMLLLSVLHSAWMPRFFALAGDAERSAVIAASRDILYRLLIPVACGLAIGAPLVMRVWAPPSYRPETLSWVISIVIVTVLPYAAQLSTSRQLTTAGKTVPIAIATLIGAAVNIFLNFLTIPTFGLAGSAASTIVSYVVLFAITVICARRTPRVPGPSWRLRLGLCAAAALTLSVAALPQHGLTWFRVAAVAVTLVWFFAVLLRQHRGVGPGSTQAFSRTSAINIARIVVPRSRRGESSVKETQ